MAYRVFKFGGALMKDAQGMRRVASFISEYQCEPLIVVVSALGKTTNALESLLRLQAGMEKEALQQQYFSLKHQHLMLVRELELPDEDQVIELLEDLFYGLWTALNRQHSDSYERYDAVVSYGELFSSAIMEALVRAEAIPVLRINARELIATDSNFTNAGINWPKTEEQVSLIKDHAVGQVIITQGFLGADDQGRTTTLGREGSDFTAAILATVLKAEEVTIWKDVPGVMNADPNRFDEAVQFMNLSYHEAIELAFYGATVIHPKTIQPLKEAGIPLIVRSFYNPDHIPTRITDCKDEDGKVPAIIIKDKQVLLSFSSRNLSFIQEENLTRLFHVFSRHKVHINLMQHSAVSFSVCMDEHQEKVDAIISTLEPEFSIRYNLGLQLVTLRHYTPALIERFTEGRKVYLEQRSRSTLQLLIR